MATKTLTGTLASLCVLAGLLGLWSGTAQAELTHPYLCQITGSTIPSTSECNGVGNTVPGGAFNESLQGLAVDGAGQVYVSEPGKNVVDVFDSFGGFTRQLTGTAPGVLFSELWGLAVDGSNNLWVAQVRPDAVDKFDSTGNLLAQSTGEEHWVGESTRSVAFSNASNQLYVADSRADDLWVLNSDGSFKGDIPGSEETWGARYSTIYTAADNSGGAAGGDLYVSSSRGTVSRIDGSGAAAGFSASASYISGAQLTGTPSGPFGELAGVTVDSAGHVYVADNTSHAVDEFDATGLFLGHTLGAGTPAGSFNRLESIAVGPTGKLYATDRGAANVVDVFGPAALVPDVSTGVATGVSETTATLGGIVNPQETSVTGCAFEYRSQAEASYTRTVPCAQSLPLTGGAPVAVSADVSGLTKITDYRFRLVASNANGPNYGSEQTFRTPAQPTINSVSAEVKPNEKAGQTTATVQAQITPNSNETTYHFEYGPTAAYGTSIPVPGAAIGSGTEPVAVAPAELTGLQINTTYHYRVVASNEYGTVESPDQTFTTLPPVLLESESASSVTAESATLSTQVNPLGSDTTVSFQYGSQSCTSNPIVCTEVPLLPGTDIGSGESPVPLNIHLQHLTPSATYHYRVLARNTFGAVEGPDQTFVTQSAATQVTLPDGRSWELVTPPNKQGAALIAIGSEQGADIQSSVDGSAITYGATAPFAVNPAGSRSPEVTQVFSRRQAPGVWESADITTRHNDGAVGIQGGHEAEYKLFSDDLSLGLVEPPDRTPLPPLPANAESTIYLRTANGEYKALVTAANVPTGTVFGRDSTNRGGLTYASGTSDLSHVVLNSSVKLTATPVPSGQMLYEWGAGQLQLVSILPSHAPTGAFLASSDRVGRHAISDDGSRIIWTDASSGNLYLRDMAREETVQVAEPPTQGPQQRLTFQTASADALKVFFTLDTTETEEAGPLDVFEVTTGRREALSGKSVELVKSGMKGVIGVSRDGAYVYFVNSGVLGDGAEHGAVAGGNNLYVDHFDQATGVWAPPKWIAALSANDSPTWGAAFNATPSLTNMTSRVSPDGRFLAFMSDRSLTGYDNHDVNSGVPDEEVFLYDAASGRVMCPSCNPTGARPAGLLEGGAYEENLVDYAKSWANRWLAANIPGWTSTELGTALTQSRYLGDSGRLLFNSSDALVPGDVNGKEDVYEFEPVGLGSCRPPGYGQSASVVFSAPMDGCVALVSAGTSSDESAFMGASETGGDVFFLTLSRLASTDHDTSIDLYDAHECTDAAPCAPQGALVPAACSTGDACKAAPMPQPALFGAPSSETFAGAGNLVLSAASPPKGSKSLTRAQKLSRALRACGTRPKAKRAACRRLARRRYGAKRASKSSSAGFRR